MKEDFYIEWNLQDLIFELEELQREEPSSNIEERIWIIQREIVRKIFKQ
jgi:hypothetical protein